MKKCTLFDNSGSALLSFSMPASLSDVPLNAYIDFIKTAEKLIATDTEVLSANPLRTMAQCVAYFYQIDEAALYAAAAIADNADTAPAAAAIEALFAHAVNICSGFRPNTCHPFTIEHNGDTYHISTVLTATNANPTLNLTTAEAVEALELLRAVNQQLPNDADGSYIYSYYVTLCALLLRKDGETLPTSQLHFDAFVNERKRTFANINAQSALEVDFFLMSTSSTSNQTQSTIGHLTRCLFTLTLETALRAKRKPKPTYQPKSERAKPSNALDGGTYTSKPPAGTATASKLPNKHPSPTLSH